MDRDRPQTGVLLSGWASKRRIFRFFSALIALGLLSACVGRLNSEPPTKSPPAGTDHLVLRHKELFQPSSPSGLESFASVSSYPLLEEYPFLRLRPQQRILKGIRERSWKGERWKLEEYYVKTEQNVIQLGLYGTEEFVHFDWNVTIESADKLFSGIAGSGRDGEYVLSVKQFDTLREQIARIYPETIISRRDLALAPEKLIREGERVFVHREAVLYIRHGLYYPEGKIENSFVKYGANIGNGILESEIELLVKGPYETAPLYWDGANNMAPPTETDQRSAILREFRKMNEFNAFVDKLLKEAGIEAGQ